MAFFIILGGRWEWEKKKITKRDILLCSEFVVSRCYLNENRGIYHCCGLTKINRKRRQAETPQHHMNEATIFRRYYRCVLLVV